MIYRLQLYADEGVVPLNELARRLWTILQTWRAAEPRADRWRYETEDGAEAGVSSLDDCLAAIESHSYAWHYGDERRVSYEPQLAAGDLDAPLIRVRYTCGIGELGLPGVFAPSRFEVLVDSSITSDDGARLLQTWMLTAIEVLRPRFGHAGSSEVPRPALPLDPEASVPVGWLTYLSHAQGTVPAKLPAPSVAYPAPDGTLLVAHPELFLDYSAAHRQAVNALHDALAGAGLLAIAGS